MKPKLLSVKLYGSSGNNEVREFEVYAPFFEDAEFHIDDYKQVFQNRLDAGVYLVSSYATFTWQNDSNNFILDSWNR
jgi:hypothetical protein